jgi:hypothetical protein
VFEWSQAWSNGARADYRAGMAAITRETMLAFHGSPQALVQALIPLPDHGVVYVRVPKAACSTLKLWAHRIHTGDHSFDPGDVHHGVEVPMAHRLGWDVVSAMLAGGAYRFTFVRDPSDRLVSAYFSKLVRSGWKTDRVDVRSTLGLAPEVEVTFDHFLASLEATEPSTWNVHWRPQHLITMQGLVEYDAIGRVENFDADLARIREEAGLPDVPVTSRNRHPLTEDPRSGRPDVQRRIEALYPEDYEVFGY